MALTLILLAVAAMPPLVFFGLAALGAWYGSLSAREPLCAPGDGGMTAWASASSPNEVSNPCVVNVAPYAVSAAS